MKRDIKVGIGHIVLNRNPAPSSKKGGHPRIFGHACCGQTAGWIKMSFGTEVGLSQGDIVLDGDLAHPQKGAQQPSPTFRPMSCGQTAGWINGSRCHYVHVCMHLCTVYMHVQSHHFESALQVCEGSEQKMLLYPTCNLGYNIILQQVSLQQHVIRTYTKLLLGVFGTS